MDGKWDWFCEPKKRSLWSPVRFAKTRQHKPLRFEKLIVYVRVEFEVLCMSLKHAEIMHAHHTHTVSTCRIFHDIPKPRKQAEWKKPKKFKRPTRPNTPKPKKPASIWQQRLHHRSLSTFNRYPTDAQPMYHPASPNEHVQSSNIHRKVRSWRQTGQVARIETTECEEQLWGKSKAPILAKSREFRPRNYLVDSQVWIQVSLIRRDLPRIASIVAKVLGLPCLMPSAARVVATTVPPRHRILMRNHQIRHCNPHLE